MSIAPMPTTGSWEAYNELLLHGSLDRFTKILARYELFRRVICLPGDIVECGVFKGTGVLYWAKLIQIFNPLSIRRVVGFDTFRGFLPSEERPSEEKAGAGLVDESDYVPVGVEDIVNIAAEQGLERRIELIAGDATRTIPHYVAENPGFRTALINLDFDVYAPTRAALECLWDRLVPGGIVALDEYAARPWGESDAADEFLRGKRVRYETFPWALSPTAFVVKDERT